jgi:DNA-binding MarR family transcriptional regulator
MATSSSRGAARPRFQGETDVHKFLRCSHILSSTLRELLEDRFLTQLGPRPLTSTQFCCLKLITLNPDLQLGEVARRLNVSAAATSKAADRLVRLGLVSRSVPPDDRRATLLAASDQGQALVTDYERMKAEHVAGAVEDLGADDLDTLCALLERVCLGLLAGEPASDVPCLRCAGYHEPDCRIAVGRGECGFRSRRRSAVTDDEVSGLEARGRAR